MLLLKVFQASNKRKVRYLVVGGVATVLYGNPRFAKDLDVWVDAAEENLKKLIAAVKSLEFIPRVPMKAEDFISKENRKRWRREKNMLAFTFINPKNPFENVDILTEGPVPFNLAYQRKKMFRAGTVKIPTLSQTDLIRMKQKAGRPQDLEDVRILKATSLKKTHEKT